MIRLFTLVSLFLTAGFGLLTAQSAVDATTLAATYLQAHAADFGLTDKDVAEFKLTDSYASPDGARHLYFQQAYRAMGVQGAVAAVHVKNGKVGYATSEFIAGLADRVATTSPVLDSRAAVLAAAQALDIAAAGAPTLQSRNADGSFTYRWNEISAEPITVSSVLFPAADRQIYAAWNVGIDQRHTPDVYQIFVDGQDGHLLHRMNLTRYCSFHGTNHTHAGERIAAHRAAAPALPLHRAMLESSLTKTTLVDGATYNVFPFTVESPIYGERELLVEPADPEASPFGWHDTNGQPGAEFTITRGNNVHAYPDADGDNEIDAFVTDGGDSLLFDFYYADGEGPDTLLPAAVTQLFYMNNVIHDLTWHHGFDEAAGNFQQRNYTDDGEGQDYVRAEAQDGSGLDNANFSTPVDGSRPRMQMFLWDNSSNSVMRVEDPASVAGSYSTVTADFGDEIGPIALTAQLAVATSGQPGITGEQVCGPVSNVTEVAGKIALIRRGECNFEDKVFYAEQAGAVGVIICNAGAAIGGMTGPGEFAVTIPSVLIAESDCVSLRALINGGTAVTATFQQIDVPLVDGDFDNGIVAHEYGHGISNRTIGGPGNSSCMQNDEQMGEGWSDFFTLVTSARSDQDGTEARGIGNFAVGAGTSSGGIRRLPYSTDFSINDNTYDRIITSGTAPHPLGEIWASVIWDLYWAMVDEYGFDEDVMAGNGGNNQAVQLVIEGMKYTQCGPGMVDGRNGILAADLLLNDGANQCLIWKVFARRGLGYLAEQGSA
ncbi:MAG: M36 family metallopeptidase, partial [Saprospiraceae bacterium]